MRRMFVILAAAALLAVQSGCIVVNSEKTEVRDASAKEKSAEVKPADAKPADGCGCSGK
ncbi:MAG TPA: hypothetical protein PL033_03710 [Candidatus Brocadiia bacterium]|nr:hypothetical protein [Candidatus Brocadiia bacterium]